jgi:hypothetical protein
MEMKPHAPPLISAIEFGIGVAVEHADVKGGFHGRGFVIKRKLHAPPPL